MTEREVGQMQIDIAVIKEKVEAIVLAFDKLCCSKHDDQIIELDKKVDRMRTVWATVTGGVVLVSALVVIVVNIVKIWG